MTNYNDNGCRVLSFRYALRASSVLFAVGCVAQAHAQESKQTAQNAAPVIEDI
ncbi:MAG: hypothetical protein RL481_1841, partial [Pseudomonadota bacterium]